MHRSNMQSTLDVQLCNSQIGNLPKRRTVPWKKKEKPKNPNLLLEQDWPNPIPRIVFIVGEIPIPRIFLDP